jgi:hypothetical protein
MAEPPNVIAPPPMEDAMGPRESVVPLAVYVPVPISQAAPSSIT